MKPPKEGSRKRKVWDALKKGDVANAIETGARLGLADSSVRTWLGQWGSKPPKVVTHPTGPIERVRLEPRKVERVRLLKVEPCKSKPGFGGPLTERGRCYDIGNKNKVGQVLVLGSDQSEVKWPDGSKQIVNNNMLRNARMAKP